MIRPNYRGIQPLVVHHLNKVGGEDSFENVFKVVKEVYPKVNRVQLAANIIQLQWNDHVVWESSCVVAMEEYLRGEKGER